MVSNKRKRDDKPHIYFMNGWWRVSVAPKGTSRSHFQPWNNAHKYVGILNVARSSHERLSMPWLLSEDL